MTATQQQQKHTHTTKLENKHKRTTQALTVGVGRGGVTFNMTSTKAPTRSASSSFHHQPTNSKSKKNSSTIPKWARVVRQQNELTRKSKSSLKSSAAESFVPPKENTNGVTQNPPQRRSARVVAVAATAAAEAAAKRVQEAGRGRTNNSKHNNASSDIANEELIWRQWCYRLHVQQKIEGAMNHALQQLFTPFTEQLEDFCQIPTPSQPPTPMTMTDPILTEDEEGIAPPPSAKKPRLRMGDDEKEDEQDKEPQQSKQVNETLNSSFSFERYTMKPCTVFDPQLLPIIILQTTTRVSTKELLSSSVATTGTTARSAAAAAATASTTCCNTTNTQTSILDRTCLLHYFGSHYWKRLHPNTAVISLSLQMLTESSASLQDVLRVMVQQCLQQEQEEGLQRYFYQRYLNPTKLRKRQRRCSFQDILLLWAQHTKTITSILVTLYDGGHPFLHRRIRHDLMQCFTNLRSNHGLPLSLVLLDSSSNNNSTTSIYSTNDFLSSGSSSCQGHGIRIRHISVSCDDWFDLFWTAYCSSSGNLLGDVEKHEENREGSTKWHGADTVTMTASLSSHAAKKFSSGGPTMIPPLAILKKLQSNYWIHHRSVYETITQLQQVLAHDLSRKGRACTWWWWSLTTGKKFTTSSHHNNQERTPKSHTPNCTSSMIPSSFWQAGLLAWFTTYVSAKRWLLVDDSDNDGGAKSFQNRGGATTGCEIYEYYNEKKESVGDWFGVLLSILTSLAVVQDDGGPYSVWCPLRPQQTLQGGAKSSPITSSSSSEFEAVPLRRLLQILANVRRRLLSLVDSTTKNHQNEDELFLRTYLNRKCTGVNDLENATARPALDSGGDPWTRNLVKRVNELIVLVGEQLQQQQHQDDDKTGESSTLPLLRTSWHELVDQIQQRVDMLGSTMRRRARVVVRTGTDKEPIQEEPNDSTKNHRLDEDFDSSISDVVWDTAYRSLSAHVRRETVDAAFAMAFSSGVDQPILENQGIPASVKTILPISNIPGLLLEALFLRDRIIISRDEWFDLFCDTVRDTLGYDHPTAARANRQDYANLFVLGVWYLVQCGLVQEKLQHVTSYVSGKQQRGGVVVVYEKTSLVWCSGDG